MAKTNNAEKVRLKREADELLRNPVMKEFFNRAEQQLFDRWKVTMETDKREELFLQHLGLKAFEEFFRQVIIDGDMALREQQQQENK